MLLKQLVNLIMIGSIDFHVVLILKVVNGLLIIITWLMWASEIKASIIYSSLLACVLFCKLHERSSQPFNMFPQFFCAQPPPPPPVFPTTTTSSHIYQEILQFAEVWCFLCCLQYSVQISKLSVCGGGGKGGRDAECSAQCLPSEPSVLCM